MKLILKTSVEIALATSLVTHSRLLRRLRLRHRRARTVRRPLPSQIFIRLLCIIPVAAAAFWSENLRS